MDELNLSALGKATSYKDQYDPSLLFPIPRLGKRRELGVEDYSQIFTGVDIWNAYEISFLNAKGKPVVALGEFQVPADSPNLIESKSLKLYLNSFNNSHFTSLADVASLIRNDLSTAAGKEVVVQLCDVKESTTAIVSFDGTLLDELDISCNEYTTNRELLKTKADGTNGRQVLVSHLLKSNCLVTGQPDWGSVRISYEGSRRLDEEAVLRYLVSFRNHNEFHEQCVERIFCDITAICKPEFLAVEARYTRRGGLDINPCRSSQPGFQFGNPRLSRQ